MKYIIYTMGLNENFGVPALVIGTSVLIKSSDPEAEIICCTTDKPGKTVQADLNREGIEIKQYNGGIKTFLDALKVRFHLKKSSASDFVNCIRSCDVAADVYGIYFCDRFKKEYRGLIKTLRGIYGMFEVCVLAKMFGKKTIKTPASYGPITQKTDKICAKIAAKYIFDKMYGRERSACDALKGVSGTKVAWAPDVANLLPYTKEPKERMRIGIAVSSQIVRKWPVAENYIDCMANLIQHIQGAYDAEVVLFANEIHKTNPYNDLHLAKDIISRFDGDSCVTLFDSQNELFMAQRNAIASCDVVVSARYHSCVAALSAGVPVLAVGWHDKYTELMKIYEQSAYIVRDKDCSASVLIERFDAIWKEKEAISEHLKKQGKLVREMLYDSFKLEFRAKKH